MYLQHKIRAGAPDMKLPERDPTIIATAYKKQRLYLFTRREPADAEDAAVSYASDVFSQPRFLSLRSLPYHMKWLTFWVLHAKHITQQVLVALVPTAGFLFQITTWRFVDPRCKI